MTRLYNEPIHSGSDAWANELAIEYTEDPDEVPPTCPPSPATAETLEALADAARCAFAPLEYGAPEADTHRDADPRPVQGCDDAAVLKGW